MPSVRTPQADSAPGTGSAGPVGTVSTVSTVSNASPLPGAPVPAGAGRVALVVAGVLFVLYPVIRPWSDQTTDGMPAAFSSPAWILAHLSAVIGFVLLPLGLLALRAWTGAGPGMRTAGAAVLTAWLGAGLVLPYYGAEMFALHAIGTRVGATGDTGLLDLVDAVRMGPAQLTVFGLGLVLLAVSGVLTAVAVWRGAVAAGRSRATRWSGVPLAVALVLYLPQFFAGADLRIAHGVLAGIGFVTLAVVLGRK